MPTNQAENTNHTNANCPIITSFRTLFPRKHTPDQLTFRMPVRGSVFCKVPAKGIEGAHGVGRHAELYDVGWDRPSQNQFALHKPGQASLLRFRKTRHQTFTR